MSDRYALYGMCVQSDRDLPGLIHATGPADIVVTGSGERARFEEGRAATLGDDRWFVWGRLGDDWDYIRFAGLFEFVVSPDGRSIVGRPGADVDPETYAVYLLNQVLSFALLKHGREPVHATVVACGGSAVAICGPPGAGKTTLAAALLGRGARMVTDDLLVINWVPNGRPMAQPGAPRIKLLPDTGERLMPDLARGVRMNPNTAKQIVRLPPDRVASDEITLGLVAVLRPSRPGSVAVRALVPRRLLLDLVANTFNPVVGTSERLALSFREDVRLAEAVPGVSVTLPRDWAALEEACERLEARLSRSRGRFDPV